jgi:hypothetical protein
MLIAKQQGANRWQPCKSPTILHSSPLSHNSNSDIYPFDEPQGPRYSQHQAITATPTPKEANRLQPCTILHSSPPSHNLKSGLYHKPQGPRYWQHQAITATGTPTPKYENLRAPRYHDLSCDRLTQKHHVQSEHLVPQSDVSKHGTSVTESQQNSYLQGSVNNASGPKVSRFNSKREAVPADRKCISEMPRTEQVSSPESPLGCWI